MPLESEHLPVATGIPNPGRAVRATGKNPFAIAREGHVTHGLAMPFQAEYQVARNRIPHFGRLVIAGCGNSPAVRREKKPVDPTAMATEDKQWFTGRCRPDADGGVTVLTARGDSLAIGGIGGNMNRVPMASKTEQLLAGER